MSTGGSPKPKWAGRFNSAVRKSSTILSFGRPGSRASSINEGRDGRSSFDSASIIQPKVDTSEATLQPPAPIDDHKLPTPILESPVNQADLLGSSSLGKVINQEVRSTSPEAMDTTSPVGYVPPPLIDSTIGNPGAFTDLPDEELPQSAPVSDPFLPPSIRRTPSTRAPSAHDPPASAPEPGVSTSRDTPAAPSGLNGPWGATEALVAMPEPVPAAPTAADSDVPARLPTPSFDKPANAAATHFDPSIPQRAPPADTELGKNIANVPASNGEVKDHRADPSPVPAPPNPVPPIPVDITSIMPMPVPIMPMPVPSHNPVSQSGEPLYHAMPVDEINSATEIWAASPRSEARSNGSVHLEYASLVGEAANNQAKSPPPLPQITVSKSDAPSMPQPQPAPAQDNRDEQREPALPLPPFHDVVSPRSTHHGPSDVSHYRVDDDETQPLLKTSKGPSYLQPPTTAQNTNVNVSPMNGTIGGSWHPQNIAAVPKLHELGWIEYHLPDGTFYYVHPTRRVTTDVNLRTEKILKSVTDYLDSSKECVPSGCEMWLRDVGTSRKGFVPSRSWVNHQARTVVVDTGYTGDKKKKQKAPEEDQLDMEYRYWSFIEGHPAHTTLPLNSKTEAFEALSWAWTDRLLPSNQVVPAPFSQDECQELNNLLRSFNTDQDGIQTRLVARILIRVAIWRQAFFRPNKPLPTDVVSHTFPTVRRRRPIIRSFFDVVISIICLGIPYIFFERHSQHRIDEESNFRSVGPMFIIGACTCIVAAIVLSASVTFLSLSGLDNYARVAGLIATLFASFSMAATLVAIFKYKADMVRSAPQIGEGIMWVSKRSFIFSLPMVFLAYAIIGFIAAIILYSVRDVGLPNQSFTIQSGFSSMGWATVGAVGALAGAVTMSLLLHRR
ncbi:hypothetical protein AN958_02531 [Leucoagaricus sp. SymC.cos]|nr:hypothetical protein AN958_02531 [Leucoagaricus sp. SymC.cos]